MVTERSITLMGEEFPTCGECGARLTVSDQPVDHDQDGPIFAGLCPKGHGVTLLQDAPEEDEEEGEEA